MYEIIKEGEAKIKVPKEKRISKDLPVFYNPVMEFNRTVSVKILKSVKNKNMSIGMPLGGTGVRACRFLKELPKEKIRELWINDHDKEAVKVIRQNLRLNKSKADVFNDDANIFMLKSRGFDYIDVDPFGSPNMFLDSAVKRLGREGILAVTATDTGCLAGSFINACIRKYWARPLRDSNMHETGLRILIRKVQLIGAEHDKALVPIFSYFKDHYFRVFFRCEKGKKKVDSLMEKHDMHREAGPLWTGRLWDKKTAKEISDGEGSFLETIAKESKIDILGFYHIPSFCKKNRLEVMKQDKIISGIRKKGYNVEATHFAPNSLRSDIPEEKIVKIMKRR